MKKIGLLLLAVLFSYLGLYGVVYGAASTYITGSLVNIDDITNKITVRVTNQKSTVTKTYGVTKNTVYMINGEPAVLKAFKSGMKVTLGLNGNQLKILKGWSVSDSPKGTTEPEVRMRTGVISRVDGNEIWVRLAYGEVKPFVVTKGTTVLKSGKKMDMRAVLEGDRVKLYFNAATPTSVQKLEIQDDFIEIKGLYKGKLQSYDRKTNQLVMTDVQVFKDAQWRPYKALLSIYCGTDYPVYSGPDKIDPNAISQYAGTYIFVATKMFGDREQAERVLLESKNERTYSEPIDRYNFNTEQIVLQNKTFLIHAGTLLIRNGRFVDKFGLQNATHAFVSADAGYQSEPHFANIVYTYNEGMEKSQLNNDRIYWGTLDTILDGKLWLKDFYTLAEHRWEFQYNDVVELNYDNESLLLDYTNNITINPNELDRKNYAVDERNPYAVYHGLKDWFGYIYVNNDRVVRMGMWRYPDNIPSQNVTIGVAEKVVGSILTINDPKDWSISRTHWIPNGSALQLDISKALIMKDGVAAQPSDIKQGNNIYVVRAGIKGFIVIVT